MRMFSTYIKAINPNTGELCTFSGMPIQGPSAQWVREYCDNNGLGYLFVGDELVETISAEPGSTDKVDYYTQKLN